MHRRDFLKLTAATGLASHLPRLTAAEPSRSGRVEGYPLAAPAGEAILAAGGTAADAAAAAALVAAVVGPQHCGVGGYGGHMTPAPADGSTVTAIDFNTAAPAAATPDMF